VNAVKDRKNQLNVPSAGSLFSRPFLPDALQRFTLTCGREEHFSIAVSLFPRASIVHDNK
jgi:hypothetical protein